MMQTTFAFGSPQAQKNNPLAQRQAIVRMFDKANSRAKRRRLLARFTGQTTQLKALQAQSNKADGQVLGVQTISLDQIVGSEGRCHDFDNHFWPLKNHNADRWLGVAQAMANKKGLPPVQLIQTEAGYFVRDGHHRISVARAFGQATIEAELISYKATN